MYFPVQSCEMARRGGVRVTDACESDMRVNGARLAWEIFACAFRFKSLVQLHEPFCVVSQT